jgi:hypothetical protein
MRHSEYSRPFGIRDRKNRQAGADQSPLADPPPQLEPKAYEQRSKIHPWMAQGELNERAPSGGPNARRPQERSMGRPSNATIFQRKQKKITSSDIETLRKNWEEQTKAISPMLARDNAPSQEKESARMPESELQADFSNPYFQPSEEAANMQRIFEEANQISADEKITKQWRSAVFERSSKRLWRTTHQAMMVDDKASVTSSMLKEILFATPVVTSKEWDFKMTSSVDHGCKLPSIRTGVIALQDVNFSQTSLQTNVDLDVPCRHPTRS